MYKDTLRLERSLHVIKSMGAPDTYTAREEESHVLTRCSLSSFEPHVRLSGPRRCIHAQFQKLYKKSCCIIKSFVLTSKPSKGKR